MAIASVPLCIVNYLDRRFGAIQRSKRTRKSDNNAHGVQVNTAVQVEIRDLGVTSWLTGFLRYSSFLLFVPDLAPS